MNVPKIVYDDFYKFVTSFSIILFLISIGVITYLFTSVIKLNLNPDVYSNTRDFYVLLAVISICSFSWSIWNWRINQKKLDAKLDAETALKILEVKKTAVNYEKQINELAEQEQPFSATFDILKQMKISKARARVERTSRKK